MSSIPDPALEQAHRMLTYMEDTTINGPNDTPEWITAARAAVQEVMSDE